MSFEDTNSKIDNEIMNILFPEMIHWVLHYINSENTELVERIQNINKMLKNLVIFAVHDASELTQIIETLK